MSLSTTSHPPGGAGSSNASTSVVEGEARARRNPREGEVAVFPLWPSCRTAAPGTAEDRHFRHAEAQVARGGGACGRNIQCVEYAVNPALEEAYNEKREEMTRRLGSAGVNEQILFHGTSLANSEAILRENFRLDRVGAEGRIPIPLICHTALLHPTSCSATCTHVTPLGGRAKAWCLLIHAEATISLKQAHMCTRPGLTAGGVESSVRVDPAPWWEAQRTRDTSAEASTSRQRVVRVLPTHGTAADCSSSKYSSVG